jgi:hypothetical protein
MNYDKQRQPPSNTQSGSDLAYNGGRLNGMGNWDWGGKARIYRLLPTLIILLAKDAPWEGVGHIDDSDL